MKICIKGGQLSIDGLTHEEAACIQMGLHLLADFGGTSAEDDSLPNWGGLEQESHWPHEIERNKVSCKEIRAFENAFWDEYEANVHEIQTTLCLLTIKDKAAKVDLEKKAQRAA